MNTQKEACETLRKKNKHLTFSSAEKKKEREKVPSLRMYYLTGCHWGDRDLPNSNLESFCKISDVKMEEGSQTELPGEARRITE